jgi:hypothetical protein
MVMTAVPKMRRRSYLISLDIYFPPIGFKSMLPRVCGNTARTTYAPYSFLQLAH